MSTKNTPVKIKNLYINSIAILILLNFLFSFSCSASDMNLKTLLNNIKYKHNWIINCEKNTCNLSSAHKPPFPYTANSEVVFTVNVEKNSSFSSLEKLIEYEVEGIKQSATIAPYMEEDYKPNSDNMVVLIKKIADKDVGFIKYRMNYDGPLAFSVTHHMMMNSDSIIYTHLIVVFAAHQDEVQADQTLILKTLADAFAK